VLDNIQITPPVRNYVPRTTRRDKTTAVRVGRIRDVGEYPTRDSVGGHFWIFRAGYLVHFADHVTRSSMGVERLAVREHRITRRTLLTFGVELYRSSISQCDRSDGILRFGIGEQLAELVC
jgi:hypothetical protein